MPRLGRRSAPLAIGSRASPPKHRQKSHNTAPPPDRYFADQPAASLAATAMRLNTSRQSPSAVWRNRRSDGYHGQSSRPMSQRQLGILRSATKVGLPSAPARCALIESEVTTR